MVTDIRSATSTKSESFNARSLMRNQYKLPLVILILVSLISTATFLSTILDIDVLKYITVLGQLILLISSIIIIKRSRKNINWGPVIVILLIVSIYPISRILIDLFGDFTFKNLTDGFVIFGSYYQLPIIALALAITSKEVNNFELLYKYSKLALPIGIFLMFFSINVTLEEYKIFSGQLAINNFFIPIALLSFFPKKRHMMFFGYISVFLIAYISSKIWSRSYSLVGAYFAIFSLVSLSKAKKYKLIFYFIFILVACEYFDMFSFFNQDSLIRDVSVNEKFQFDTLLNAVGDFLSDGDFVKLFNWEGNSRSGIVIDAYKNFDTSDWLFGRGIFGKYKSFVERHTIEIGWAQETFRWGIPYAIFIVLTFSVLCKKMMSNRTNNYDEFTWAFGVIILIRILDGFVFGIPQNTIYNLIAFWGVMNLFVVTNKKFYFRKNDKNYQKLVKADYLEKKISWV